MRTTQKKAHPQTRDRKLPEVGCLQYQSVRVENPRNCAVTGNRLTSLRVSVEVYPQFTERPSGAEKGHRSEINSNWA